MADEMTNGNDVHRFYHDALTAQLGERVTNLGRWQSYFERETRSGFKHMDISTYRSRGCIIPLYISVSFALGRTGADAAI